MRSRRTMILGPALAAALLGAACGGSGGSDDTTTTAAPETTAADTTVPDTTAPDTTVPEEPAGGAIASYTEAQGGTIQIVANGTFRDPEFGFASNAGSGSGFFISPDGYAVTNNHVVTGAATLEVFVGGDPSQGYNAQIIGVSECNDLALVKVSVPEDQPFFEWFDGEISAGLDVYAAGFPLGDPEFTLTRGIVAKARAGGDLTGTSSIDYTIEHDANIQPGNSGGPLISPEGQVVAVNYAGGAIATTTAQFFAIASPLAQRVVEQLYDGDFESLGINGWAVYDDSIGVSGIWVAGVDAGSAASRAGVLPGDIITSMNGLPMGMDGTFKDYCDVIRTAGDRAIAIEVLRWDTSEVLRGELNSEQALQVSVSFGDEVGEQTDLDPGETYTGFQTITDDTRTITVDVPSSWNSIDTTPYVVDGDELPYIGASPDLDGYITSYGTPGVEMVVLPAASIGGATAADLLEDFGPGEGECTFGTRDVYDDGVFAGEYDIYVDCGGINTTFVVLVSFPKSGTGDAFVVVFQAVTDADLDALTRVLDTFNFL